MSDSSLVRVLSLVVVMVVVGYARYGIGLARLNKQGVDEGEGETQEALTAKKWALVAAFLYMVGMLSVAGLFM